MGWYRIIHSKGNTVKKMEEAGFKKGFEVTETDLFFEIHDDIFLLEMLRLARKFDVMFVERHGIDVICLDDKNNRFARQ